LKKDRNCNMNSYPVYPTYPGTMPIMNQGMMPNQMMGMNMGMPNNIMMPTVPNTNIMGQNIGGIDSQVSALSNQVSNLERRVSRLENMVSSNNTPKYNESNYYMV